MTESREVVSIRSLAAGGDGVGRLADGRTVFVPRTAPGDRVELGRTRLHRNFARAELRRIVEASPDRAEPRCVHYVRDDCGGCVLQHVAPEAQLRAKGRFVRDALERIAKIQPGDVDVVPNPSPFGWRSRLSLSVDMRSGAVGMRRLGRPSEVFALDRCEIASPGLQRLVTALCAVPGGVPSRTMRVDLRESRDGALSVMLHGDAAPEAAARLSTELRDAGVSADVRAARPAERGEGAPPRAGAAGGRHGRRDRDDETLDADAAAVFEQVDRAMGDLVRAHAVGRLGDVRGRHVWDLYAGLGETSALLAAAGATVESVEADSLAVAEAERRGPAGVVRHTARVEDALPRLAPSGAAIVNPPRAGLGAEVVAALLPPSLAAGSSRGAKIRSDAGDAPAVRAPQTIVYVSCDPATLARDLGAMREVYDLVSVRAFDSFPQTAHVETVAELRRRA